MSVNKIGILGIEFYEILTLNNLMHHTDYSELSKLTNTPRSVIVEIITNERGAKIEVINTIKDFYKERIKNKKKAIFEIKELIGNENQNNLNP